MERTYWLSLVTIPQWVSFPRMREIAHQKYLHGFFLGSSNAPQPKPRNQFSRISNSQTTWFHARMCIFVLENNNLTFKPPYSRKNHYFRPRPRSFRGRFMVRTQGGSVLHLCTKIKADTVIRSKVLRGSQNLKIRSLDLGHAHLWVILSSICRNGPSSISRGSSETTHL